IAERTESDGLRWARLGAGWSEALLESVVAERAFLRDALRWAHVNDAEWTRCHAVAAPVARRFLYVDRVELGTDDRAGRADLQTRRVRAVLAYVRHHEPCGFRAARVRAELLDELDVPPVHVREAARVVVAVPG